MSCIDNGGVRSTRRFADGATPEPLEDRGVGTPSAPGDGSIDSDVISDIITGGKVELRHIVDPFEGTYKSKVSIPKNFSGPLYLSGLNVTSLSNRLVKVRFNFGREMEAIEVPATVGRAPGITPQTDIEVLILDMDKRDFDPVRLLYDLFDYNNYDSNGDGVEFGAGDDMVVPVSDNGNGGLYCRGLKIEHDPTFVRTPGNDKCDRPGERCLYAYAKIKDSGLVNDRLIAEIPGEPHIAHGNRLSGLASVDTALAMALPDDAGKEFLENILRLNLDPGIALNLPGGPLNFGSVIEFRDESAVPHVSMSYTYRGPYRPIALNQWEISHLALLSDMTSPAVTMPTGLFQDFVVNATGDSRFDCSTQGRTSGCAHRGTKSFLFPRAVKMELSEGVGHYSSPEPLYGTSGRQLNTLGVSGESGYMDGVNMRVVGYDSSLNEGIGSCNVTATIEILVRDDSGGNWVSVSSGSEVKLQLTRAGLTNNRGLEVLYSAMKSCSSSASCGGDECCYNKRCWSKSLIGQCLEDTVVEGNLSVGENCRSDYQCSSLCCNVATTTCAPHSRTLGEEVLCSKSPGQLCVAKEWCRKENVPQCFIVKTGRTPQGEQVCALRCYNVPAFGSCRNGVCYPPTQPPVPNFDPDNPDCDGAIDPPEF